MTTPAKNKKQNRQIGPSAFPEMLPNEIADMLIGQGYSPVPCNGKRPTGKEWPERKFKASDFRWKANVGIKTGQGIALIDIDVTDADALEAIAEEWEARHPQCPRRTGHAPKTAFLVRSDLDKKIDRKLTGLPTDNKGNPQKIEVLANGQQFIAYGIHPDTDKAYRWHDLEPLDPCGGSKDDLPFVSAAEIKDFVNWVAARYAKKRSSTSISSEVVNSSKKAANKKKGEVARRLNEAALANLDAWVPKLLPKAKKQATGAWRITSKDLNRDLEEDLSIHSDGVMDFGTEKRSTPLHLVLKYGDKGTPKAAALWLYEQLQLNPADLGIDQPNLLPDWAKDWVYNEKLMEFHQLSTGHSIKMTAFNAKFDRMEEPKGFETNASSFVLDYMETVANTMYWPCDDKFVAYNDLKYVNTYRRHDVCAVEPSDADAKAAVQTVVAHARSIVADEKDAEILLDFLAFVYQNPGKRVRWAILLFGIPGNGKSFFVELMKRLLGHNAREVAGTIVAQRFTGWAVDKLFIAIEEIRVPSESKYAVLDKLKPFISNNEINVEEKGRDDRVVPNFASYMLLTNHDDALPLDEGDRRYCIIETKHKSKTELPKPEYFEALFAALENHIGAIAHSFATRQISDSFNPNGRAPETRGRFRMIQESKSRHRLVVEAALEEIKSDVVNSDLVYVKELRDAEDFLADQLPDQRIIGKQLKEMGFVKYTVGKNAKGPRIGGKERTIYYRPDKAKPEEFMQVIEAYISKAEGG